MFEGRIFVGTTEDACNDLSARVVVQDRERMRWDLFVPWNA